VQLEKDREAGKKNFKRNRRGDQDDRAAVERQDPRRQACLLDGRNKHRSE
jgi:hypothetical protein